VRTAQRLAVDGDHIAVAEERRNLRQHPPEGGIQRLRIDQPEHRWDWCDATVSHA